VQLLIDNSGSMNGFGDVMPTVQLWMRQSLSSLMGSFVRLRQPSRGCYFNQKIGIGECVDLAAGFNTPFGRFHTEGDTNFHEAIRSATDYDLSLVITDGVDFTGNGSGDCAGGVDAACVANSLKEVMDVYILSGLPDAGGAWIIPLASRFEGTYFSEQHILAQDFNSSEVVQRVRNEVRQDVHIGRVRQERNGGLIYDYQGPREWFLLVIARPAALGRAAVHALQAQADMPASGTHPVHDLSEWREGLGVFGPVEIFPGYLPRGTLGDFQPLGGSEDISGKTYCPPIDATWNAGGELSLLSKTHGEALRQLTLSHEESPSRCSPLGMIMPFQMQLEPHGAGNFQDPIHSYNLSWSQARLDLHLVADGNVVLPPCGGAGIQAAWRAKPNLDKAADCLVTESCTSGSSALLRMINATNPAMEPHRIFGLLPTLRLFLNQSSGKSPELTLAEFRVCQ
jgi:hypothetical protein